MAKLNDTTVIMILLFLSVIGMVISTGYKNPHFLSYKFVTIYNIQGNCRYCKVWIDSTTIGFTQCLLGYDKDQRSHVIKGINSCDKMSIVNSVEHNMFLKSGSNTDLEIISVNSNGGVAIRDPITNKCLTHNVEDNLIKPYGLTDIQLFTSCLPYNSDVKQVFYFSPYLMESTNTVGCKSPTSVNVEFKLFETTSSVFTALGNVILDNSNITISGVNNYIYNVGANSSNNNFILFVEAGSYEIDLTLKYPLSFTFTKFTVNILSTTTIVQIDVTENLVNETQVEVYFFNSTLSVNVSTGFLAENSNLIIGTKTKIIDTNNYWSLLFTLPVGNHTISLTTKFPLVIQFTGPFNIAISNQNPITITLNFSTILFDFNTNGIAYMNLPIGNSSMAKAISWENIGTDVITTWNKVQVLPYSLEDIWIRFNDFTYTSSTGQIINSNHLGTVTQVNFAFTMGCESPNSIDATAYVNFTGTPFRFRIDAESKVIPVGFMPNGDVVITSDRKSAIIRGGGYCGWNYPSIRSGTVDIFDGIVEYVPP